MVNRTEAGVALAAPKSGTDTALTSDKPTRHYAALDALRGIAAAVVVFCHFGRLWDATSIKQPLLAGLQALLQFGAAGAVVLFFLLSGFVLSLPYKRGNSLPYGKFALRRIARIYLPYLAAACFALICYWRLQGPLPVSEWFNQTWTAPLNWRLVLSSLLLVGNSDTAQVNTAFWSLAVEMRLSLLFPLICLPLLRWRRMPVLGCLFLVAILDIAVPYRMQRFLDPISLHNASDMTLGLFCFVVGILLSRYLEQIRPRWQRMKAGEHWLILVVSAVLLEFGGLVGHIHVIGPAADALVIAGGAGVLISTLFSKELHRILAHGFPVLLGRMSYSLYLVHGTVLFALVHLLFGRVSRAQMFLPYVACTVGVTWLMFTLVEKPAIRLSQRIGRTNASVKLVSNGVAAD